VDYLNRDYKDVKVERDVKAKEKKRKREKDAKDKDYKNKEAKLKVDAKKSSEIKVEGDAKVKSNKDAKAKGKSGFLIGGGIHIGGKGKEKDLNHLPHHQKIKMERKRIK